MYTICHLFSFCWASKWHLRQQDYFSRLKLHKHRQTERNVQRITDTVTVHRQDSSPTHFFSGSLEADPGVLDRWLKLQRGLDLLILPDYLFISSDFSKNLNYTVSSSTLALPQGGYSNFFRIRRLGPSIYRSPQTNIRNFKHPKKIFEILETKKNIPILCLDLKKRP